MDFDLSEQQGEAKEENHSCVLSYWAKIEKSVQHVYFLEIALTQSINGNFFVNEGK